MNLAEVQDVFATFARDMRELAFNFEVQQLLAGAKRLPVHLLPKPIQHTLYLSWVKGPRPDGRRPIVGIRTKDGQEFLATVDDVSVDLVVLNTDISHPDARPRARRCIRISDIETLGVVPTKATENSK